MSLNTSEWSSGASVLEQYRALAAELDTAPAKLSDNRCSKLHDSERALGKGLVAESLYVASNPGAPSALLNALQDRPEKLDYPLVEWEVLRRRCPSRWRSRTSHAGTSIGTSCSGPPTSPPRS